MNFLFIFSLSFTLLGGLYWIKTKCLCWKSKSVFAPMVYKSVRFFPEYWSVWHISHSLSIFFLISLLSPYLMDRNICSHSLLWLVNSVSWASCGSLVAIWCDEMCSCFFPNFSTNFHMLPWTYWSRFLLSLTIRIITNKTLLFPLILTKAQLWPNTSYIILIEVLILYFLLFGMLHYHCC